MELIVCLYALREHNILNRLTICENFLTQSIYVYACRLVFNGRLQFLSDCKNKEKKNTHKNLNYFLMSLHDFPFFTLVASSLPLVLNLNKNTVFPSA